MFEDGNTIAEASDQANGRSTGFDYLRLALAVSVLLWHSFQIQDASLRIVGWYRPLVCLILPMFFALSGFLISGSLVRVKHIHEFAVLRAIRIIPALAVETVLSTVVIGAFFTTLPAMVYFTHPQTLSYLLNVVGIIHRTLPGVFETNPIGFTNAPLWTIPFELECYLVIVGAWLFGLIRKRHHLLILTVALQIAVPTWEMARHGAPIYGMTVSGRILLLSFLFGILLFLYKDVVRLRGSYFIGCVFLIVGLLSNSASSYFVAAPAAYLTAYVGLTNFKRSRLLLSGDYSYGIYLYSFPLQQAVYSYLDVGHLWWGNFSVGLALASACAAFSWHVVEKPVLKGRKPIVAAFDRALSSLTKCRMTRDHLAESPIDAKLGD